MGLHRRDAGGPGLAHHRARGRASFRAFGRRHARDRGWRVSLLLGFRGVACERGGRLLFEGLSFALGPGEAALVTGPNGAGKSSLVRVATGLLAPAAGAVAGDAGRALLA